jgi:hypothetical protein
MADIALELVLDRLLSACKLAAKLDSKELTQVMEITMRLLGMSAGFMQLYFVFM